MNPDVTVLIPFYNRGKFLVEALKSVFSQTYKGWKVILVDDASTDDSAAMIAEFLADPRVKIVRNPVNLGQSKTMNVGLALVDTEYLVQLDDDDWFVPETLEVLMEEARKQPKDVALVTANYTRVSAGKKKGKWRFNVYKGRAVNDRYDFLLNIDTFRPRFYRTAALRDVGGWPTDGLYEDRFCEDLRILLRLIEKYRFHWIDRMLYYYRIHDGNLTKMENRAKHRKVLKWLYRDTLKRWGDKYKPVFAVTKDGYITVVKLEPKSTPGKSKHKKRRKPKKPGCPNHPGAK